MKHLISSCVMAALLAGCVETTTVPTGTSRPSTPVVTKPATTKKPSTSRGSMTPADFNAVLARVEPVAESVCRARQPRANCDFKIVIDRKTKSANAWQSLDPSGRPVLTFSVPLLRKVHNRDELAFIIGHEAAHHASGHLTRTATTAITGAVLGGILASVTGGDAAAVKSAQELGAKVGSRTYSKSFELEADKIGAIIAYRAGYNPVRGVEYFTRIPDPGDKFLGSHPANAQRIETVRRVMAGL